MISTCHRCHGELPQAGGRDDEAVLFCPRCSAPQLRLPEHMRVESRDVLTAASTGALPPPRAADPHGVDWPVALTAALGVALTAAVLTIVGLKLAGVALLGTLWVLSGSVIALGLYRRRAARAWVDARVGLRVGLVTGLLMLAAIGVAGAVTGVVLRFATHEMARFDEQSAQQAKATQAWAVNFLARQGQDKATQDRYVEMLNSPMMTAPEMKAGSELASLGFEAVVILMISAGSGAFVGLLQGRRGAAVSNQ